MKNWATLEPNVVKIVPNNRFTPGRNGRRIDKVVIHHNAGVLTVDQIYNVWLQRVASAHYQVESNGWIGQLVWDRDTAWHAANTFINETSIGIEVSNSGGAPGWPIDPRAVENAARLTASICRFFTLGRPVDGLNVRWHREFTSTSCPYRLAPGGVDYARFMDRARYWYDQMGTAVPSPVPVPPPTPKETEVTKEQADRIERKLDENKQLLNLVLDQIAGPRHNGVQEFTGWDQNGKRTLNDTVAAIAEEVGIPNTYDTAKGRK
ncbi:MULTISPECIES: peptidoglycan recognition protein family protein [unclassified Dietzia]|uniref:peptidoglycan recognition protein family protein n=1 Tax=unclassified Dietzia TaxID=2617939 RepID=UPI0015F7F2C2|nr:MULTISPECIES: peptidoglycan recognition family protein [unclassified Dietzia]MBB1023345.1 N-acetylmuramoyl-L-alanine amidase [Dietzia sp. DQ12-76]MBB1027524.1 N-acetylmuramoyl-L-alanine amidase [Dietzia sp. DQ11-38-2]